jgi:hypothetical protein
MLLKRMQTVAALSVALMVTACGGGNADIASSAPLPPPPPAVAVVPTQVQAVSSESIKTVDISAAGAASAESEKQKRAWRALAFEFAGEVKQGASTGTKLAGKLVLYGDTPAADGSVAVEGKLITERDRSNQPQLTPEQKARLDALEQQYRTDVKALAQKYRDDSEALITTLTEALKALSPQPTAEELQKARDAIAAFNKAFGELSRKFRDDLGALREKLEADIKALNLPEKQSPVQLIPVTGTLAKDGGLTVTFDLGSAGKINGTGKPDASGNYAGDFTGPAADDKGTWTAKALGSHGGGTMPPRPPEPKPNPMSCNSANNAVAIVGKVADYKSVSDFKLAKGVFFINGGEGIKIDASKSEFKKGSAADLKDGVGIAACGDGPLQMDAATAFMPRLISFFK